MDIKVGNVSADPQVIKAMGKEAFIAAHPHVLQPEEVYNEFVKQAGTTVSEADLEKVETKKSK
jgi:hypothetical protein